MKAPIPEDEENLIVEYIYTNYLINILENDYKLTEKLNFKISEAYESLIKNKLKILRSTHRKIKAELKSLNIKVAEPIKDDIFIEYAYFPHGYEGKMRFWEAAMEYEGTRRLKDLFGVE